MIPDLVYYQLVIIILLWLCFMLPPLWPSPHRGMPTRPGAPIKPKRNGSRELKAFAGLTHKPHCALCEQETVRRLQRLRDGLILYPPTNRRPRTVDTSMHFCPHTGCDYRGWRGLGNVRANGHPKGGPWRQLHCTAREGYLPEHHGTILHGKQAEAHSITFNGNPLSLSRWS
jgi:hypothetical protein